MTTKEWWNEEPYYDKSQHCDDYYCHTDKGYNIPLIIEAVEKRGETEVFLNDMGHYACKACRHWFHGTKQKEFNFCPHCGLKINWD